MSDLEQQHPEAYAAARHLIEHGVPIFAAKPARSFPDGGHGDTGYRLPKNWQTIEPDLGVLDDWRPGWALAAVMGHTVDGLDIDTNKGGSLPPEQIPASYGTAVTPSGGTHDLIAPLGLRSRDGLVTGVDYKGGISGVGHGFLFIAPTVKKAKSGELGQYEWTNSPELDLLAMVGTDESGAALTALIREARSHTEDGRPEYEGPEYPDLSPERQEQADKYLEDAIFEWRMVLGDASGWDEGVTDRLGRGWEMLARDCAWAVARLAVCPWTGVTEDRAQALYLDLLPEAIAADAKCRNKWYEGILEKAAAKPANQPPWWSEVFFEQTPVLQTIQQAALSTMNVPEGLLAILLGRVLAEVPPWVMLPPVSYGGAGGAVAGLNLGIALVGPSGGGKSGSVKASRQLLGLVGLEQKDIEEGAGSGEGMIDMFLEEEKTPDPKSEEGAMKGTGKYVIKADPRVIYNVDEVEQLAAVGSDRQGSTLNSIMRTALTGGALKTSNTRAGGRYRAVDEDAYRLVVLVGIQPSRSDVLLSPREESVGTPQRFLWARITDKNIQLPDPLPSWPESLDWSAPTDWPETIEYPDHVRMELLEQKRRQVMEEATSAEGHAMLTRLKVSFALAVLHGETKISDQWWSLAGLLIEQSRAVQSMCKKALAEASQASEISRATRTARATMAAEETVTEDRLEKCAAAILRRIRKSPGEEFNWSQVKPAFRIRGDLETSEILGELAKTPDVVIREYEAQGRAAWGIKWVSAL